MKLLKFFFLAPAGLPAFFNLGLLFILFFFISVINGCDRNSSPEGRMSIKLENLQKQLTDSLRKQNATMLDSLGSIREELRKLREEKK